MYDGQQLLAISVVNLDTKTKVGDFLAHYVMVGQHKGVVTTTYHGPTGEMRIIIMGDTQVKAVSRPEGKGTMLYIGSPEGFTDWEEFNGSTQRSHQP